MSAQWALSLPCLMTTALWPSQIKSPVNPVPMILHGLTAGPMLWARRLCPQAHTAGWWMWVRVVHLRWDSAMPVWSAKALGTRHGWGITLSPGCCPTMMVTIHSAMLGKKCPCRSWGDPRRSVSCWTGPARHSCFTSQTLMLYYTQSHRHSVPRCCQHVLWLTEVSQYYADGLGHCQRQTRLFLTVWKKLFYFIQFKILNFNLFSVVLFS